MAGPAFRSLPDGGLRVRLGWRERELLVDTARRLRPVLTGDEDLPRARERLFPPAYDDPRAEAEYRGLVGDSLVEERVAALDAFVATLEGGQTRLFAWSATLDAEQAAAWLSATQDLRLILAERLGVTDESHWETGPDLGDRFSLLLYYLGWLQERLLAALAGRLPD
ncbi:MAG: DUF2017 domain-containing protein [Actinomycetota bacterium]|nr:DUF2017 domain-containing protein [Actinomycetota bacterium]